MIVGRVWVAGGPVFEANVAPAPDDDGGSPVEIRRNNELVGRGIWTGTRIEDCDADFLPIGVYEELEEALREAEAREEFVDRHPETWRPHLVVIDRREGPIERPGTLFGDVFTLRVQLERLSHDSSILPDNELLLARLPLDDCHRPAATIRIEPTDILVFPLDLSAFRRENDLWVAETRCQLAREAAARNPSLELSAKFTFDGVFVGKTAWEYPIGRRLKRRAPDLRVTILEQGKGLAWHIDIPYQHVVDACGLPDGTRQMTAESAAQIEQAQHHLLDWSAEQERTPDAVIRALRTFGSHLYEGASQVFKDTYWCLRDYLGPTFSIQLICSTESFIAWEFMRPQRDPDSRPDLMLLQAHPIARTTIDADFKKLNDAGEIPKGDIVVIAPAYDESLRPHLPQLPGALAWISTEAS